MLNLLLGETVRLIATVETAIVGYELAVAAGPARAASIRIKKSLEELYERRSALIIKQWAHPLG